jgi:hypothetical protein
LRLEKVCQILIAKEQSAFIRGRYILESVVVAHKIVHTIHQSKEPDIVLKLHYEKTYDRVNLDFLVEILRSRGFGDKWIGWIQDIVFGSSVSVLANGEASSTFKTGKWLRQRNPLSPLLFNLVADVLTRMLDKASGEGLVCGFLGQFRRGGILSLQYADDTLLFSICDNKALRNLKCIMVLFEKVSGIRINFHKSEFIPMNLEIERIHEITHTLNCHVGNFP